MSKVDQQNAAGVTLVISSLTCGGAERALKNMAEYWARHGRPVTFITLYSSDFDFYTLSPQVRRVDLGLDDDSMSLWNLGRLALKVVGKLRKAVQKAGNPIVVSFMSRTNILTLLATRFMDVSVLVTEQKDPRIKPLGNLLEFMRKKIYPSATAVTVLTRDQKENWASSFLDTSKVAVIPNPLVELDYSNSDTPFDLPASYITSLGRLVRDKGYDLLIDAFAQVAEDCPEEYLVIMGEGPERMRLEQLIVDYNLPDRILLVGAVENPGPILRKADCFVLSSRGEGFPLALLEAMRSGTACISFDCLSGPSEIIRHNIDGIIVPPENVEALAESILELVRDEEKRNRLGRIAMDEIEERFGMDVIMGMWDELLLQCHGEE